MLPLSLSLLFLPWKSLPLLFLAHYFPRSKREIEEDLLSFQPSRNLSSHLFPLISFAPSRLHPRRREETDSASGIQSLFFISLPLYPSSSLILTIPILFLSPLIQVWSDQMSSPTTKIPSIYQANPSLHSFFILFLPLCLPTISVFTVSSLSIFSNPIIINILSSSFEMRVNQIKKENFFGWKYYFSHFSPWIFSPFIRSFSPLSILFPVSIPSFFPRVVLWIIS